MLSRYVLLRRLQQWRAIKSRGLVGLLFLCCRVGEPLPPIGSLALGGFSRVPAGGFFLQFLNFEILDLSLLAKPAGLSEGRRDLRDLRSLRSFSCGSQAPIPQPRPKTSQNLVPVPVPAFPGFPGVRCSQRTKRLP